MRHVTGVSGASRSGVDGIAKSIRRWALAGGHDGLELVAEAAQQWLDAKDDGDHDLVSEAREDLAAALAESQDLLNAIERLA